jgi:hypothetical protein
MEEEGKEGEEGGRRMGVSREGKEEVEMEIERS